MHLVPEESGNRDCAGAEVRGIGLAYDLALVVNAPGCRIGNSEVTQVCPYASGPDNGMGFSGGICPVASSISGCIDSINLTSCALRIEILHLDSFEESPENGVVVSGHIIRSTADHKVVVNTVGPAAAAS